MEEQGSGSQLLTSRSAGSSIQISLLGQEDADCSKRTAIGAARIGLEVLQSLHRTTSTVDTPGIRIALTKLTVLETATSSASDPATT